QLRVNAPPPTESSTLSLHDALPILQAQQALQKASKRFVEVDAEQQTQLAALEKLLPAVREDMDRALQPHAIALPPESPWEKQSLDRKSTRLNSSHEWISYAVFCLKK